MENLKHKKDTKWEFHPNDPNIIKLHTKVRVSCGHACLHCEETEGMSPQARNLLKEMLATDGIEAVTISGYEIKLGKAELFSWSKLQPLILNHFDRYAKKRQENR